MPGEGVRLLGKTEDGSFRLGAAADEATALGDKDALYTVGQALLAVRDKNLDALAGMATYPLYLDWRPAMRSTTRTSCYRSTRQSRFSPMRSVNLSCTPIS